MVSPNAKEIARRLANNNALPAANPTYMNLGTYVQVDVPGAMRIEDIAGAVAELNAVLDERYGRGVGPRLSPRDEGTYEGKHHHSVSMVADSALVRQYQNLFAGIAGPAGGLDSASYSGTKNERRY